MENWLSIAAGVYLLSMVLYGHYRGFIRLAVSMVALVAALAIVHVSMPKVTEYLKENTSIQQTLSDSMKQAAGIGLPDETGDGEEKDVPSVQRTIIENLNLPQNVKAAMIENNNHEVYELLGVNAFADYIGNYLADMILNSVGFVLLFAIVYLLIRLVAVSYTHLDVYKRQKVGWLTLYAGIAGGADIILLPEIPYDLDIVVEALKSRTKRGKRFSILAVAEGAISKEDAALTKKELKEKKKNGVIYPSVAYEIGAQITERTGQEAVSYTHLDVYKRQVWNL